MSKIDGFAQKDIGGVIFDRVNNPNRSDGTWMDPEKKTMVAAYRGAEYTVKQVQRKASQVPAHLALAPDGESKDGEKLRERQITAFKDAQKGRFDLYVAQGNPITVMAKLSVNEDMEEPEAEDPPEDEE